MTPISSNTAGAVLLARRITVGYIVDCLPRKSKFSQLPGHYFRPLFPSFDNFGPDINHPTRVVFSITRVVELSRTNPAETSDTARSAPSVRKTTSRTGVAELTRVLPGKSGFRYVPRGRPGRPRKAIDASRSPFSQSASPVRSRILIALTQWWLFRPSLQGRPFNAPSRPRPFNARSMLQAAPEHRGLPGR